MFYSTGVKRGIGLLSLAVQVAASFTTALTYFNELEESAKIILAVSNYCKWPIKVISIEVINGQTNSAMAVVAPSTKGGLTASEEGSIFSAGGTEGYIAWTMDEHSFCVIYWRVGPQKKITSLPNAMAVGCRPFEGTTVDDWEESIQKVRSDPNSYSDIHMEYHIYDTSQRVIQFCNDHICVQGILFSASQGEAKIEIFPLNVANVASSLQNELTQEIIEQTTTTDDKFGDAENRKRSGSLNIGAIIGILVGAIGFIVLLVVFCVWYKKRNRY